MKMGAKGCLVATKDEMIRVEGYKVKAVDTTRAGDAFNAGFIVGLSNGWDLNKTAEFANASGALTTPGKGAIEPIPTRKQVEEFIRERSK